ncbi:MAG: polysaccharide deacetylase family protein, partial [Pseudomonadota bacterium]
KKFALLLTHDIDTLRGHDRSIALMNEEKKLGFKSAFYFVAQSYVNSLEVHSELKKNGNEIGLHGIYHDHKTFQSRKNFLKRIDSINHYLHAWQAEGFRAPSMLCNLSWLHDLHITYDSSTYDFDPFEPTGGGVGKIFPFKITDPKTGKAYVEIPYTLPQDFTVFILMKDKTIEHYKKKLDWLVKQGGMAHIITHPDYMRFQGDPVSEETYPVEYYIEFLNYIKMHYEGQYWMALCKDVASFYTEISTKGKNV